MIDNMCRQKCVREIKSRPLNSGEMALLMAVRNTRIFKYNGVCVYKPLYLRFTAIKRKKIRV